MKRHPPLILWTAESMPFVEMLCEFNAGPRIDACPTTPVRNGMRDVIEDEMEMRRRASGERWRPAHLVLKVWDEATGNLRIAVIMSEPRTTVLWVDDLPPALLARGRSQDVEDFVIAAAVIRS